MAVERRAVPAPAPSPNINGRQDAKLFELRSNYRCATPATRRVARTPQMQRLWRLLHSRLNDWPLGVTSARSAVRPRSSLHQNSESMSWLRRSRCLQKPSGAAIDVILCGLQSQRAMWRLRSCPTTVDPHVSDDPPSSNMVSFSGPHFRLRSRRVPFDYPRLLACWVGKPNFQLSRGNVLGRRLVPSTEHRQVDVSAAFHFFSQLLRDGLVALPKDQ